ncbi:MAG: hypothetical protein KDD70_03785 [Bdellovibrionales bacterium]|nr:hypothetical protein [Bdellovibrionales bacterium]
MSQGVETKFDPSLLERERSKKALEEGFMKVAAQVHQPSPDLQQEISKESIEVDRSSINPELQLESKLSSRLDRYRERLNGADLANNTKQTARERFLAKSPEEAAEKDKFSPLRPSKSASVSRGEPSLMADPIGFLANILKKLEEVLLGKLEGPDELEELEALKKVKTKVKRKKKSSISTKKEKKGLYHLDEAQEEEELVDLEVALAEAKAELSATNGISSESKK